MRWGIPLKTNDEVPDALETLIKEVADPEGICIGKIHCDGAAYFKGRFLAMCRSFGIAVETSPPYVPQGNAIAERGFRTVIGAARSLMLGAPHLPRQLWTEAVKAAIYIKHRTPTDVLDGKTPLELSARVKKYMVGYNTTSKTWRLWDPAEPLKITNSAEVSFREVDARDVARPVHGSDPFPEQGQIFQPGIITGAETKDDEPEPAETNDGPDEESPAVCKSGRTAKPRDRLNLFTTEQVFETEYALVIGGEIGNLGQGIPGQQGYMPADPSNYRAAVNGPDAVGWMNSMEVENRSLLYHDVYEWVDPPRDAQIIPSKYMYKWKYNEAGIAVRQKSRIVVQGFHEAETGTDNAAPVASLQAVHLIVAHAAKNRLVLRQADIRTAFLHARMEPRSKAVCTRPDITHSVMVLTRSMEKPGPRVMQKLKRVLRYLKGTISIGVRYGEDADDGNVITAFVDSDFAGDLDKGYPTTGVVLYFAGGPVEWTSSKQTVVVTSSVEAEFVALSKGCNNIKFFRHLLDTINQTQEEATVVWEEDSEAASVSPQGLSTLT
ncbi:unnamed protein product [Ectocarpus sp. CCAP 1310/34]|nr:unnamed protein product [Ectocarpus sp. CCAP 1310/34]